MKARKTIRPVAQYLDEFGLAPPAIGLGEISQDASGLDLPDEPAVQDPEVLLRAAREEGISEGCATAREEYETHIVQERLEFEARLVTERDRWVKQESEKLSDGIKAAILDVESNIAGSVERILTPFVVESMRRRMVDLLAEHVGALLGGSEGPMVKIHGPQDLLAMLREKLAEVSCTIDFSADASADVRIIAGQTMIESRIESWLERIKSLPE